MNMKYFKKFCIYFTAHSVHAKHPTTHKQELGRLRCIYRLYCPSLQTEKENIRCRWIVVASHDICREIIPFIKVNTESSQIIVRIIFQTVFTFIYPLKKGKY